MNTSKTPLTARQREVLTILVDSTKAGLQASVRELTTRLGLTSTHAVDQHLVALKQKGCLDRSVGALSRALVLTDRAYEETGYRRCACGSWTKEGTL